MALAELGGRVAVQFQGQWQRSLGVGSERAVARGRGGDLRDAPHPHRVMVATGEQGLSGRGTEGSGVESGVLQSPCGQTLRRRCVDRSPECAAGPESDVVEQYHQDIGSTVGGKKRLDRREGGVRVLGVVSGEAGGGSIRDGQ